MKQEDIRRVLLNNYSNEGPRCYLTCTVPLGLLPPVERPARRWLALVGHAEYLKDQPDWVVLSYLAVAQNGSKSSTVFVHDGLLYVTFCVKPHQRAAMNRFVSSLVYAAQSAEGCGQPMTLLEKPMYPSDLGVPDEEETEE